ncbi:hypothetical protein [Prosthecobacter sp.]|uniref:hypothetical protein n=1 Tax=Prosthecobacter sp. TaxID=1965333 RepID=UPI002ABBA807|nr:hypothetical protein [Prosthecobacter sp.]MDZ4405800.1 hypothetical protein [Prosthecobacter sp.]
MKYDKYLRRYEDRDWRSFKQMVQRMYGPHYIFTNKRFVDWQHRHNGSPSSLFLIDLAGELKGVLGSVPLSLNFFGRDLFAWCYANIRVDPELRKVGLGVALIEYGRAPDKLVYGMGHSDEMTSVYRNLGWRSNILLKRYLKVLNPGHVERLKTQDSPLTAERKPLEDGFSQNSCVQIDSFDETVDDFWLSVREKYPITINRYSSYLNWRYADHPMIPYKMFVCRGPDGEVQGYAIVRIEDSSGYRIARIIDFVSSDAAEASLLMHVVGYGEKNDVDLVDFFFSGAFHVPALLAAGFISNEMPGYETIPMLFNPIDRNRKTVNFAYYLPSEELRLQGDDPDKWYVTKGDGDIDRPY